MTAFRHGPELLAGGGVRFRLWAPIPGDVRLRLDAPERTVPMQALEDGWRTVDVPLATAGTRYRFELPDGRLVPDPASRLQPEDVHGPSEVIDPAAFAWTDAGWRGRPWREAVLYELHLGAFTPEGTFRAAIARLDHLADLGVTGIEIMPVGDFPGARNWGYDGVFPFAPDSAYGRPEDFKALVDAAHARGLMVLLDVVYNHFGPDGNVLPAVAPAAFTSRHKTPWGDALNYDGKDSSPFRQFVVENARYWVRDYHLDGLRLDAVHAIIDQSPEHILAAIAGAVRAEAGHRQAHLVLENEHNEARWLVRGPDGRPRLYDAQWNDDVHHALHVAATGEDAGYYADYQGDTARLGRALAEGFAFQGEQMPYRGSARGEPSAFLPPDAFIAFLQNHDQIGNRAFGERITALASPEAVRAVSAVFLLLPQVPMLFMGEEWAAPQPFPFFCAFEGELADAVRRGRREEFKRFPAFQDPAMLQKIPDPQAEATFLSAKLDWSDLQRSGHADWLDWHRRILARRRGAILPLLPRIGGDAGRYEVIGEAAVSVAWRLDGGGELKLDANLSGRPAAGFAVPAGAPVWLEGALAADGALAPWTVRWTMAS